MEMTSGLRLLVRFSGDDMRHYGAKEIHLENEWAILEQYNAKQFGPDVLLWRHFSSIVTPVQGTYCTDTPSAQTLRYDHFAL